MSIIYGPLGTTLENNEMFGNPQFIKLTPEVRLNGRPKVYEGVHGLLKYEDQIHLLCEDDGQFWTHWILTTAEIKELLELTKVIQNVVMLKPNYKFAIKSTEILQHTKGVFNSDIELRGEASPLIYIYKHGYTSVLVFDVFWIEGLRMVLEQGAQHA